MNKRKDEYSVVTFEKEPLGEKPVGVKQVEHLDDGVDLNYYFPALTASAYNNLYGRMMTLLEATTDKDRLNVVKNLFQREMNDWFENLEKSVREIDQDENQGAHGYYYKNVYVYPRTMGRAIRGDHPEVAGLDI